MKAQKKETAFAFCLDEIRHRQAYFRTVSLFSGAFGKHGRDQRMAHPVITVNFESIMRLLGQPFTWVRSADDVIVWRDEFGWALVPTEHAVQCFGELLGPRECVKSAIGLYWDVELPRNRAISRRIPKDVRQRVLDRDEHRCIECGKTPADGVTLTMDHVIPYSRGGETTEGNLVTLCEPCNQGHSDVYHPHLFSLAGLHHEWDRRLLTTELVSDPTARDFAVMLSQNIMVSRCNVDELPFTIPQSQSVGRAT